MTMSMPCIAAILAGGRATRLEGVVDKPKCLAEIQGRPFLDYQLSMLRAQGVTDVVLLLGYKSGQVIDYLGAGAAFGMRARYSVEPEPLGTAGAVQFAQSLLSESFFLLNGDTLVDVDLQALATVQRGHAESWGTLSLCAMDDTSDYGSVDVDAAGRVVGFREKARGAGAGLVNAGVYLFDPKVIALIPSGTAYSVETDLMPSLLAGGHALYGHRFQGEFVDIGTPQRLAMAQGHSLFGRLAVEAP